MAICMLIDNLFGINRILDGRDLCVYRVYFGNFKEIYFANVERYDLIRLIGRVNASLNGNFENALHADNFWTMKHPFFDNPYF